MRGRKTEIPHLCFGYAKLVLIKILSYAHSLAVEIHIEAKCMEELMNWVRFEDFLFPCMHSFVGVRTRHNKNLIHKSRVKFRKIVVREDEF